MKKVFRNIAFKIYLYFCGFFYGMKSVGDAMTTSNAGGSADEGQEEQIKQNSLYSSLLRGEVTQEVMETRDSTYRVYKEAKNYKYIGNGNVQKKNDSLSEKHTPVDESDGLKVVLIQYNNAIVKGVYEALSDLENHDKNIKHVVKITRQNCPRFKLEDYATKIVYKKDKDGNAVVDLYFSIYPRKYIHSDALFIREIETIMNGNYRVNDVIDFDSLNFITDKAFGSDDIKYYEFNNFKYLCTSIFDGSFVMKFSSDVVFDGVDLTEKFKTKEMDEKYEAKARKENYIENPFEIAAIQDEKRKKEEDAEKGSEVLKQYFLGK